MPGERNVGARHAGEMITRPARREYGNSMYKVLTLNNIAVEGLRHFPRERYEVASEIAHPDAIILRSYNMHDMDIPETVAAVGRAGAGTNNIPIDALAHRGVPVFNAPGANANAVKELTIAGLFMGARNLADAAAVCAGCYSAACGCSRSRLLVSLLSAVR